MQDLHADRQAGLEDGGLYQLHQVGVVGISAGALGHLEDQGGVDFLSGLGDALYDLHVVHVESTDRITAVICLLKHFLSGNQWHRSSSPF